MGWEVTTAGIGKAFTLRRQTASDPPNLLDAKVTFMDEADSHAAGEAIRAFLGRPSVTELLKQKQALEAENLQLRTQAGARSAAVDAANERADALDRGHPERLGIAQEVVALRHENARLKGELRDLKDGKPAAEPVPDVERLQARVALLEAEVADLAGSSVPDPAPTVES